MNEIVIAALIVGGVILLIVGLASMWKKAPQDKALVITGLKKRVITGGGGFVIPVFERIDRISLENMKIRVTANGALTEQGVPIQAEAVAVIKVKSDEESILAAVEQYNTGNEQHTIEVIKDFCSQVLDGKLREIISTMTVEGIYKDREQFTAKVQEVATKDLALMGLEIITFAINDISDSNGYLKALGMPQIAGVKRDAAIAEAEAEKETKIKTALALQKGEEAKLLAQTEIARAEKDKEIKIQEFRKESLAEKAKADLAYEIETNKSRKEVVENEMQIELLRQDRIKELTEKEMLVEITRKQKEIEKETLEVTRKAAELQASIEKMADAEKYKAQKEAEAKQYKDIQEAEAIAKAIVLEGNARAEAKKAEGMAEVEIILQKGKAEAEAMARKAEAYKLYGEAAITQMIIEQLAPIAREIAQPLTKTEKIVVIDNGNGADGNGAARVTNYVTDIITKLPETVQALTGINLVDMVSKKYSADSAAATSEKVAEKTKDLHTQLHKELVKQTTTEATDINLE